MGTLSVDTRHAEPFVRAQLGRLHTRFGTCFLDTGSPLWLLIALHVKLTASGWPLTHSPDPPLPSMDRWI